MRLITQAAVIVVLAGLGGGAWYLWQNRTEGGAAPNPNQPGRGGGAPITVDVLPARIGTVIERTESVGTARANESVTITAKQAGIVAQINFIEGQRVRAGAALIELEAGERRADVDQARAQRDEIRQRLDRARQLRPGGNVAEARLDELGSQLRAADARVRAMDARFEDSRITAPFEGRVGLRQVSLGALLQPGTPVTTLDDVSKIKLEFAVPETVLAQLALGLNVIGRTSAYPGRIFEGKVSVIDTRIDPATRAVRVNALFDNKDEILKPGLFLNVDLALSRRENAILIREEALLAEGLRQFVFVVEGDRVKRREVRLGVRLQGEVEIVQGLTAGALVIVRGVQRVRDGQSVNTRPFGPPAS
jgi:membrane fusion protein (multidrug efflux system)